MTDYEYVYTSPERTNIYYEVYYRTDIEIDLKYVVDELHLNKIKMPRVIIYVQIYTVFS